MIDKKFRFNHHVEGIVEKSKKLIHSLSRAAKISWGQCSDVVKIIYKGAILPLLSYGIPVWIDALSYNCSINRLKQVQRWINLKITKAFSTSTHMALCILAGTTPIHIEPKAIDELYNITKGRKFHTTETILDLPTQYPNCPHPGDIINIQPKQEGLDYTIEIYTDGSKGEQGVGSGIAIFIDNEPKHQLKHRLHNRCSNN